MEIWCPPPSLHLPLAFRFKNSDWCWLKVAILRKRRLFPKKKGKSDGWRHTAVASPRQNGGRRWLRSITFNRISHSFFFYFLFLFFLISPLFSSLPVSRQSLRPLCVLSALFFSKLESILKIADSATVFEFDCYSLFMGRLNDRNFFNKVSISDI